MADDNPDNVLSTAFPAPPPFWKHFTPDNRSRLKELQDAAKPSDDDAATGSAPTIPAADLAPELRYLQPPAPPPNGKYRSFGDPYDINTALTSLKDMGVEQLYPSPPHSPSTSTTASQWTLDRALHIKRMTQSLLLNYLEMVGVLAVDPARWQDKYEHMQTLLFNAHHLINEYRPHQARASLIAMMEEQVKRRREEVEGVRKMREKIEGVLAGLAREGVEVGEAGGVGEGKAGEEVDWEERRREEQRAVLRALDDELIED
ncbi:RNA polymerase ii mediator complex protein [Neofusicoccum parvum]|nr:RNA polymerase ii mediator complex protein [Neofusicoccum parvum]